MNAEMIIEDLSILYPEDTSSLLAMNSSASYDTSLKILNKLKDIAQANTSEKAK